MKNKREKTEKEQFKADESRFVKRMEKTEKKERRNARKNKAEWLG